MESAETRELMRRYLEEFWVARDESALERYVHPDLVLHGHLGEEREVAGAEELKRSLDMMSEGIPDATFEIEALVAEGDIAVVAWSSTGTHTGVFQGMPPTHRVGAVRAVSAARWRDGKMVEGWQAVDVLGMLRDLRVLPPKLVPFPLRLVAAVRGRIYARRRRRRKSESPSD